MAKKYRVTWEEVVFLRGEKHDRTEYSTIFTALHDDDPIEAIPKEFIEEHKKSCPSEKATTTIIVVRVEGPL